MLSDFTSGGEDVKKDEEEDLLLREKANTPTGLLAVRVFGCTNLYLDKNIIPDHFGLYVNLTVGISSKITSVQSCHKKGKVIWDEIKNFSVPVSSKVSSVLNKVCIAVIGFDKQLPRPKYRVLGMIEFHLHKMVKKKWSLDSFELQNKKKRYAGDISLEFAFAYGTFGYGLSYQIENIHSPKEMVDQSAFPKLDPPNTTLNVLGVSCIPRKVTHPKFIPFVTKVLDLEPDLSPTYGLRVFPHDIFKIRLTLNQKMTRLKQLCGEYSLLGARVKRISYLKKMMSEKETKHRTLNEIVEQDSESDSSEGGLNIGEETTLGLSGALAQMANMTFLAGAPGIMQRRDTRPHNVPSATASFEEDVQEDSLETENQADPDKIADKPTMDSLAVDTGGLRGLLDRVRSFGKRSHSGLQTQTNKGGEVGNAGEDANDNTLEAEVPKVGVVDPPGQRWAVVTGNVQGLSTGPQTAELDKDTTPTA